MTFDEALRELDVDRDATDDALRRAYLRLLKTRKPEVDPEGFKRLREAYDVAKTARGWAPLQAPQAAAPPQPDASRVTDADAASHGEPSASAPVRDVYTLLAAGDLVGAADGMRASFDDACAQPDVLVPPIAIALATVLRLYEASEVSAAISLYAAARRWVDMTQNEARILGPVAVPWALTCELLTMPPTIDMTFRLALAQGIRSGDPTAARARLRSLSVAAPPQARDVWRFLRAHTPMVTRAMEIVRPPSTRQVPVWPVVLVLVALFNCGRSLIEEIARARLPSKATQIEEAEIDAGKDPWKVAAVNAVLLADAAYTENHVETAKSARSLYVAMSNARCDFDEMRDLREAMREQRATSADLVDRMAAFERSYARVCSDGGTP